MTPTAVLGAICLGIVVMVVALAALSGIAVGVVYLVARGITWRNGRVWARMSYFDKKDTMLSGAAVTILAVIVVMLFVVGGYGIATTFGWIATS